jgi:signal peptidase I
MLTSIGKSHRKNPIRSRVIGLLKDLLSVLTCVLVVNSFVLASFEVPTGSMEDTVKVGDRLLVNKLIYGGTTPYAIPFTSIRIPHFRMPGFREVARGDVIVFDWPGNRDQVEKPPQMWYLKRCIGLPGDTVEIDQRVVRVNGQLLSDPTHSKFLRRQAAPAGDPSPEVFPRGSAFNEDNWGPMVVPKKGMTIDLSAKNLPAWEVFLRREGHSVSLENGEVLIDGRKTSKYVAARDYIFAMGDNRDNSFDSRYWGFVPVADIAGTPWLVFWSWSPQIPFYHPFDKIRSIDPGRIGTIIR